MRKFSWRKLLGERGIDPAGLDGSVRRVIFTTYAVLLGLALATGLRDLFRHAGDYTAEPGLLIPRPIAWMAALGAILAVTFLLAGAAHASTRWRYAIIAPILLAIASPLLSGPLAPMNNLSGREHILFLAPLVFLLACIVIVAIGPRLCTRYVLAWIAALLTAFVLVAIGLSVHLWSSYAPTTLFFVMVIGAGCLVPALIVVGWDLSEMAAGGARVATSLLRPRREGLRRAFGIGLALALLAMGAWLHFRDGYRYPEGPALIAIWAACLLAAAAAALLVARWRRGRSLTGHPRYHEVVLLAILLILFGLAVSPFEEQDDRFHYKGGHSFTLQLPKGMAEDKKVREPRDCGKICDFLDTRILFLTHGKTLPTLVITAVEHPRFRLPGYTLPTFNWVVALPSRGMEILHPVFSAPDAKGWGRAEIATRNKAGKPLRFVAFRRSVNTNTSTTAADWYIACGGGEAVFAKAKTACDYAKAHFMTSLLSHPSRAAARIIDLVLFACAALAFGFALWGGGGAHGPALDLAFWMLFLAALNGMSGYLFGGLDDVLFNIHLGVDLFAAIAAAMALCGLVLELWRPAQLAGFRREDMSLVWRRVNMTLLILGVALYLYDVAISMSDKSQAIRGVVVCLALTWELFTAGPQMNPGRQHAFPRISRILIFVGYLLLLATTVFLFGDLNAAYGGYTLAALDTESLVAGGLVLLGGAYVMSHAFRTLPGLAREDPPHTNG